MEKIDKPNTEKKTDEDKEPRMWRIICIKIVIGVLLVCASASQVIIWHGASFEQNFYSYLYASGTLLLVAGACYFAGGLTGFLFGIPRMLQSPALLSENDKMRKAISQNDNLVQISDWVTKIIVGVGLTQLYNIPHFLMKTGTALSPSFGGTDLQKGRNAAIVTILYFTIIGFLSIYLWTRLYFTKKVNQLEIDLNDQLKVDVEGLKKQANQIQENLTDEGGKTSDPVDISKRQGTAAPARSFTQADYSEDTQKGKWGGKTEADDRKISAIVNSTSDPDLFEVLITVSSTNPDKPLAGYVKFHLHKTFKNPDPIIAVQDNKAVLRLRKVWGAFTVGAEVDEGQTKLELDLAALPDVPQVFKNR